MRALKLICLYVGCVALATGAFICVVDIFRWPGWYLFVREGILRIVLGCLLVLSAWKYRKNSSYWIT
jgi:hypothetical protein